MTTKIVRNLVSIIAMAFVSLYAGPFGFKAGMTLSELQKIVGEKNIQEVPQKDAYIILKSPSTSNKFKRFVAIISPDAGLIKIASFYNIETNRFGSEIQNDYKEIKKALISKYGKPSSDFNFIRKGSLWTNPEDWMQGIKRGERYLYAGWVNKNNTDLSDEIETLTLKAEAESNEAGSLRILYELRGFRTWLQKEKQSEKNMF